MKLNKRVFTLICSILMLLFLAACGDSGDKETSAEEDDSIVIKVGYISDETHPYALGLQEFTSRVEEKTDGKVTFELHGNGQLGGEREVAEQVQLGTLDMTLVTSAPLSNFVPEVSVIEMPFIFNDIEHVYETLDGDVGEELAKKIDEHGFKTLGFWENGFHHFTNDDKPITSPEDIKGMKIRTLESDHYVDAFKALGADPTPMAFPELYTSLQQGVIDGAHLPYSVFYEEKIFETQGHYSEVDMLYAAAILIVNEDIFESYPEDVQQVLMEEGKEVAQVQREISQAMVEDQKVKLKEEGIEIVDKSDVDVAAFKEMLEEANVYEKYDAEFGDLLERIRAGE